MFVNWKVHYLNEDCDTINIPDKVVSGKRYWFFEHIPKDIDVDVVGIDKNSVLSPIEAKYRFYIHPVLKNIGDIRGYDLIIAHDTQSCIFTAFLKRFGFFKNTKCILIDVGLPGAIEKYFQSYPYSLRRKFFSFCYKSVAHIIYHANQQKGYYQNVVGINATKLTFIPFGVEPEFFRHVDNRSEDIEYILTAGYGERDFATLLKTHKIGIPIEHRILSSINPYECLRIPKSLKWDGHVPINIFKTLISNAKFVVLPLQNSLRSAGMMTLLQSMAMEKAVIVSKVVSTIDYVEDGKNGLFVPPNDPVKLRNAIIYLLDNPTVAEKMGRIARKTVIERFTSKQMAKGIYEVMKKVMAEEMV